MFSVDAAVLGALTFTVSTQMVIVAVVAFIVGLIVAFLLVTPAKTRSDSIVRTHAQRGRLLEDQMRDLHDRNNELQEQNASVASERDRLRGQLDALHEHNIAAASPTGPASPVGTSNSTTNSATNPDGYSAPAARDRADQSVADERQAQADQQPPQQEESLGERIKGFFSGNNPDNTPSETPNATS